MNAQQVEPRQRMWVWILALGATIFSLDDRYDGYIGITFKEHWVFQLISAKC